MKKYDNLSEIIESIVFLSGTQVALSDIAEKLDVRVNDIENAVESLKNKYHGASGIELLTFNGKAQFCSNKAYSEYVETVLNPIKERELSKSMLEVSAIIAYKQPITRLEIEEIRGVNSDYAISVLSKNNLIEVVGRKDAIGKPLLFGTTDDFLKRFELSSLADLPSYEDVLNKIKVIKDSDSADLFHKDEFVENEYDFDAMERELKGGILPVAESVDSLNIGEESNTYDEHYDSFDDDIPDFLKGEKNLKKY